MADPNSSQVPPPGSFQPVPGSFQPVPTQQGAPPPPYGAPPPKSGPSALKVILIVLAILVGLGMIGAGIVAYGVYRVAKSVHKDADGNITVNTPKGTFTANTSDTFTASDLGIAIYPGAMQGKGGLRMNIAGKSMVSANFLTPDSSDKVIAFYKDKAGPNAQTMTTGNGGIITLESGSNSVTVTIMQSASENHGQTLITIVNSSSS